jgi:hypothetical protein
MLRKITIVLATAAVFTGGVTADAFARGAGGRAGHGGGFGGSAHMGGTFAGGRSIAFRSGFRAPMIRPATARIQGAAFAHFPHRRLVAPGVWWGDAPWYGGYYDPSIVAPDEQLTYPAPWTTPPPTPNAKVVLNPHSGALSEEPDLLRPGELLVRFPPPKKISR